MSKLNKYFYKKDTEQQQDTDFLVCREGVYVLDYNHIRYHYEGEGAHEGWLYGIGPYKSIYDAQNDNYRVNISRTPGSVSGGSSSSSDDPDNPGNSENPQVDTWEEFNNLYDYGYRQNNNRDSTRFNIAGTFPTFETNLSVYGDDHEALDEVGTYEIRYSSASFEIYKVGNPSPLVSKIWRDFRDKEIPKKLIFVLQGAGGKGGDSHDTVSGKGGNSGACIGCVIKLPVIANQEINSLYVVIGEGGDAYHNAGQDTYIYYTAYSFGQPIDIVLARAEGGQGAGSSERASVYLNFSTGLVWNLPCYTISGNTYTYHNSSSLLGPLGGSYNSNGSSTSLYRLSTRHIKEHYKHTKNIGGYNGGQKGWSQSLGSWAGGGAASYFWDGGDGGGYMGNGKDGKWGSGGGGGTWSAISTPVGGLGGDGLVRIYY